jgi:hypothetical protein
VRLVKALARIGRIDFIGEVLHACAHDHARNNPAFGDHVEHGDLFRHTLGMIVERQDVAEDN